MNAGHPPSGTRTAPASAPTAAAVFRTAPRAWPALAFLAGLLAPAPRAPAQTLEPYERDEPIVLENEYLRVTIDPVLGGSVRDLVDKRSGKSVVGTFSGDPPSQGFGLFLDRFWRKSAGQVRSLETSRYEALVVQPGSAGARPNTVILRRHVKQANAEDLLIEKTIRLWPGLARLDGNYAVSNVGQAPQLNRLWCTSALRPAGPRSEKLRYFSPAADGVVVHTHDPGRDQGENVWVEPVRDWRAVIGDSGAGAAALADSRYLEKLYHYLPSRKTGGDYPTLEWLYQSFMYKPVNPPEGDVGRGLPFKTRLIFLPFSGLDAVHGAGRSHVGELVVAPDTGNVRVRIAAAASGTVDVALRRRRLPSKEPVELGAQQVFVTPKQNAELLFAGEPLPQGTHVFTAEIASRKHGKAVLEHHVVVGESSGDYRMERLTPKAPAAIPDIRTTVSTEIESPHVKWAKPFAGGRLRVLFVLPHRALRETVEAWQRLSMEFECLPTWHVYELEAYRQKPVALDQEMLSLLRKDWDVLVFGGTYWRMFPAPVQQAIVAKVSEGTGVVYVWPYGRHFYNSIPGHAATQEEAGFVRAALPVSRIPPWQNLEPESMIELLRHKEARLCMLHYPTAPDPRQLRFKAAGGVTPRNPVSDAGYRFWEYHHSLFAKALIWAAKKTTGVRLIDLTLDASGDTPTLRAEVANRTEEDVELDLQVWAHDDLGHELDVPPRSLKLPAGHTGAASALLQAPGHLGTHFATLWVRQGKKVHDWRTVAWERPSPATLRVTQALPAVLGKDEPLRCRIEVASREALNATLVTRVVDATGRRVAEKEWPVALPQAGTTDVPVVLQPRHCLTGRHFFEAGLSAGGQRLARLRQPLGIDSRRYDDYLSILWGAGAGDYTGQVARRVLAETDCFDAVVSSAGRIEGHAGAESIADGVAANGMGIYAINLHHFHCKEPGVVRKPCLTDPGALATLRDEITHKAEWLARFAPIAYLMGDEMSLGPENGFTDFCRSPTCLDEFRAFLRETYGTVEKLNASWGTDLTSFAKAVPMTHKEAQDARKYAAWADHRQFMDTVYAGAFRFAKAALTDLDPRPTVGYSGGGTWHISVNGYNRHLLYQTCKAVTDYGVDSPDLLRCFMEGDRIGSWWWGMYGGGPENQRRHTPWMLLFRGLNGSGFFCAYGCGRTIFGDYGLLDPGFVPKAGVLADLQADVKPLREGIGKLLLSSERLNSGIAVHYSMASVRAAYVLGEAPVDERLWNRARWGIETAIRDLGLQFDVVAPAQIEGGCLADFRVLVLPLSQALSDREITAIRVFVSRGGVLVADTLTGRFDEHLVRRRDSPLRDVLGLDSGTPGEHAGAVEAADGTDVADLPKLGTPPLCAEIALRGADVLAHSDKGRTPCLMRHGCGSGVAYTLNLTFASYQSARADGGTTYLAWLSTILDQAGVRPEVRAAKGDKAMRGLEITQFRSGRATFTGLLQDFTVRPFPGEEAAVALRAEGHIYNVRTHEYLGRARQVTLPVRPYEAVLLASLPERVQRVSLAVPEAARAGDPVGVELQCGQADGYGRVVRLEVRDADGRRRRLYGANLFLTNVRGTAAVPLALNDPPGIWEITVRDVVSGITATERFTVSPRR